MKQRESVFSVFVTGMGYVRDDDLSQVKCAEDIHFSQDANEAKRMTLCERSRIMGLCADGGMMAIPLVKRGANHGN